MLPPPPNAIYPTLSQLLAATSEQQGYALVKRRFKENRAGNLPTVYLQCDRGRSFQTNIPPNEGQQVTGSRRVNCPFMAIASLRDDQ